MMVVVAMIVVVMIMIMVMMIAGVRIGVEFFGADRLLRHIGKLGDEIDHLVLEQRRPDLGESLGIVAVEVVDLALLARELPNPLEQRAVHLIVGDLDLVASTHLRQDQAEPYAPRGNVPIFVFRLLLGRAFVLETSLGLL